MRFMAIAVLIFTALNAPAEERCLPADTPRQCIQRLITTRAYENAQAALAATNPGTSTVSSPIRSAVKDFLSAASAHVDHSSVKDSGTALIIDYSFVKQINLEATFADPTASLAAETAHSLEQLSRGDDVLVTASYNLLTRRFGRNIDKPLLDSMMLALVSNSAPATAAVPVTSYDTPFVQLFPDIAPRVTAIAEFEAAALAALPAVATQLGNDMKDLANRQPQLFASGLYHHRAAAVGPDERGFRVTWEIGTDNVNTFRDHEGRDCETRGDCLEAFTNFTARTAKRRRIGRFALAIQYGRTALNSADTFTEVATNGFTYMATYGQEISSFTAQPTRFDVSYTYDGKKTTHTLTTGGSSVASPRILGYLNLNSLGAIPPSSVRNSAAFTITQPLGGNFSVPVSVVRATRDDWYFLDFQGKGFNPRLIRHSETEYHLSVRYQFSSLPRPSLSPICCCK